jgi:hypothetical protein
MPAATADMHFPFGWTIMPRPIRMKLLAFDTAAALHLA